MRIFRMGTGPLVSGRGFCYHLITYGLRLTKPFLLLPVEHLRRVSPLVSDLLSTIDPEDAPAAECRVCPCAHRPSALLEMKGHNAGRRKYDSQNIATNTCWPIVAIEPSAPS